MPLIIVTGLPCSGKSTTSKILLEYIKKRLLEENNTLKARIVTDDDSLNWDGRDSIFGSIAKEKDLRSSLRSEAARYVNLNQIVILDAPAYIKGFRYELHCMAKEAKTQYCVVELLVNKDLCWLRNQKRMEQRQDARLSDPDAPDPGYQRGTFDALLMRYEKCEENNRWDSPLFRVTEPAEEIDESILEKVFDAITKDQPLVPNKSTTQLMSTTTIYKPVKRS
uniref:Protein KTI12 homolog n=1 Tax=Aceria tosichella TaxID=561515 RepID=A0A6G1S4S5_9ACAR